VSLTITKTDLAQCAADSLEAMFFTSFFGEAQAGAAPPHLAAMVNYGGDATGSMYVGLSAPAVSAIASAFLGMSEDELTDKDATDVLFELTNVICGTTLSTRYPEGRFALQTPALASTAQLNAASCRAYELDSGILWLGSL
jgi:CheY-specific phosphatase CheX